MWEVIRKNQQKSMILLIIMGISLIVIGFVFGSVYNPEQGGIFGILIALAVYLILMLITFAGGKSIMLSVAKAREVGPDDYPQFYNVVEEMRIAAGMPYMPKVYVINDPAPNAFAAGMNPKNSVVAATTGLIDMMNRDELQGVVAHEISHINNRDIRYMTIATIMVSTIALLSQIFLRSMIYGGGRKSSNSKGGGGAQIILLVVAILFAILAPILVRLLYLSLSRKREYLADASAARLTRYPEGLAAALEKISNSTEDLRSANSSTAPMYIANPLKKRGMKLKNLSSTHPPLEERIKILRAMGGASFENYQQAYKTITNKNSIIPKSAIANDTK